MIDSPETRPFFVYESLFGLDLCSGGTTWYSAYSPLAVLIISVRRFFPTGWNGYQKGDSHLADDAITRQRLMPMRLESFPLWSPSSVSNVVRLH